MFKPQIINQHNNLFPSEEYSCAIISVSTVFTMTKWYREALKDSVWFDAFLDITCVDRET